MHENELEVTADDVRRLIAAQFPEWAALRVSPVTASGTDHRLFRLGERLLARMPRIGWAAAQADSDARWLPGLVAELPLSIPVPVATGEPDDDYPFAWSVTEWFPGDVPPEPWGAVAAAEQLGRFVRALGRVDPFGGPVIPAESTRRGGDLRRLDEGVSSAIDAAGDRIDRRATLRAWQRALEPGPMDGPGRWLHGDLLPGNIIADGDRAVAVIDWGSVGIGDPSVDLMPAWAGFEGRSREAFLGAVAPDDASIERGRGWLIAQTTIAIPYYWDRWPAFAKASVRRLGAVLEG